MPAEARLLPDGWLSALSALRSDQPAPARRVVITPSDMTLPEHVGDLFQRCRHLLRHGTRHVVIDLHDVRAADTKLIACIVALYQLARSASARLEICLSSAVLDVARICRLEWLTQELATDGANDVGAPGS